MSALAGFGVAAGAAAGVLHVLTGPDHLAAVAPISISRGRGGWSVGVAWGLGHGLGTAFLVLVALALRGLVPVDRFANLSALSEYLVGFMLLGLGGWGFWRVGNMSLHTHEHDHDGRVHRHVHLHRRTTPDAGDPCLVAGSHANHLHLPVAIGCVHGVAGGALLWLLPGLGLSKWQMVAYLLGFSIAGIGAMAMFTGFVAIVGRRGALCYRGFYRLALTLSSVLAIAVGGVWLLK